MNSATLRGVGLASLAALVLAGLFFACFEREIQELDVGYSREALQDPYLALGRLLERMGQPVKRVDGPGSLASLPPVGTTLLLPTPRRTLSEARSRALLGWVAEGGHLVVVTYTLWDEARRRPDPILDPLGLRQFQHTAQDSGEADELDPADGDEAEVFEVSEAASTPAWDFGQVEELGPPLRVNFDPRFYWEEAPEADVLWRAGGPLGTHLVQLRHGAGRVTALTDDLCLRNRYLGEANHAEFALRLLSSPQAGAPVWIVREGERPGLLALAVQYATPTLVGAGVLLVAWLWRATRRFGPLLPMPGRERRQWLEHLEAVGRFHWAHGRGRTLLAASRDALRVRIEERHPGWSRLPAAEQRAQLAQHVQGSAEETRQALEASDAGDFVKTIATLERIRASL